jgi:GNAT superfamily N-acetyltransferase
MSGAWSGPTFRFMIRRARPEDVRGIHEVHMRSIRELCSKDYGLEEILAWSGRPFDEAARLKALEVSRVWVVEREQVLNPDLDDVAYAYKIGAVEQGISGFAQLLIYQSHEQEVAEVALAMALPAKNASSDFRCKARVEAFYFGAEAAGRGLGRKIFDEMIKECRSAKVEEIELESTLTSVGFYKRLGFEVSGPPIGCQINQREIPAIPMRMDLIGRNSSQQN